MNVLTFIDVEASGLEPSSYPIQIGWLDTNGSYDEFLINPETASCWDFWDDYAESDIHKISRADCIRNGLSIYEAADRLNRLLRGLIVISDAADYDHSWIMKLMDEAGCDPTFIIMDVREYFFEQRLNGTDFFKERKQRKAIHTAISDCSRNIHSGAACGFWGVSAAFSQDFGKIEILSQCKEGEV